MPRMPYPVYDDTPGGTDALVTKAPTSNVLYDVNAVVNSHASRHQYYGADPMYQQFMADYLFAPGKYINHQFQGYTGISTYVTGTGAITQALGNPRVTSNALNDTAIQYSTGFFIGFGAAVTAIMRFANTYLSAVVDCQGFIGLAPSSVSIILETTYNVNYTGFFFKISGGSYELYAVNCDGGGLITDRTATLISTTRTEYLYRTMIANGTDIKFYYSTNLLATHTTNLPTHTALPAWKLCIQGDAAGAVSLSAGQFIYYYY